jgi:hypothetical protein
MPKRPDSPGVDKACKESLELRLDSEYPKGCAGLHAAIQGRPCEKQGFLPQL